MLEHILAYLNNWFVVPDGIHSGTFEVINGSIELPFLQEGQYFRVCDSVYNDGLYRYPTKKLIDETFDGVIWALAIPRSIIQLSDEIEQWTEKNDPGTFTSESFGGYSYSKATNAKGMPAGWKDVFADRLSRYRKSRENAAVQGLQPLNPYYIPLSPDFPWK